jgi:hypothetical protein
VILANELIIDWVKDKRLKAALEEMASHELSKIGAPEMSSTFTAHLDAGVQTVRISIKMVPEGEVFAEDIQ